MFVQVVQGKVGDEPRLRRRLDEWLAELAPGARGWLGGTYGITDDGEFVAVVRFASPEDAETNAARPEQGSWWADTETCFDGEVTFHDCPDVVTMLEGGSDTAGFVQVMQARAVDREAAMAPMTPEEQSMMSAERPDVLGGTTALCRDDDVITMTMAFRTEAEAREAERREPSPQARESMDRSMAALADLRYLDLHHPWFASRDVSVPGPRREASSERQQPAG